MATTKSSFGNTPDKFGGVGPIKPNVPKPATAAPVTAPPVTRPDSQIVVPPKQTVTRPMPSMTPEQRSKITSSGAGSRPSATPSRGGGTGGDLNTTSQVVSGGPQAVPTPVDWEQAAKELYGGFYAIIADVPDLQDLLRRAVQEGWSDAKFDYELKQTTWWKTHADSARQWDIVSQTDPASAQQQVDARVAEFQNMALSTFQVQLDDLSLQRLATASLRGNWTQQQVSNAIGYEATKTSAGLSQLATGFVGQTVKNTAADYGLKLSDQTFNQWVQRIAVGQDTKQSFQQYALNAAKTLFPGISAQLDAGQTFSQITDPYKNVAAQILEINPQGIDFLDPKWTKAITFVDDKGQQRPMNFNEWGNYLRQNRQFGYEYTSDAQSRAYEVVNNLANLFGKV
jgi:hypothetical protein